MFKFYEDTTIYVVCPAYFKTGGTELMHQLVNLICDQGFTEVFITYYGKSVDGEMINPEFRTYVGESYKLLSDVVDTTHNILILPEIRTDLLKKFEMIQTAVWFMSVDNFISRNDIKGCFQIDGLYNTILRFLRRQISFHGYWSELKQKNTVLFYQSEYAHQFLLKHGLSNCYRLSDYINQIYLSYSEKFDNKEDIVLYNPKKGKKFTEKIISASRNLHWIALENMDNTEIYQTLKKGKVYIDFGNHPGKDRFPREAAIMGCCIITGKHGAAAFYEDISINDEFKFDDTEDNIPYIIKKIEECLKEYDKEIVKFSFYRSQIRKEFQIFLEDVQAILSK